MWIKASEAEENCNYRDREGNWCLCGYNGKWKRDGEEIPAPEWVMSSSEYNTLERRIEEFFDHGLAEALEKGCSYEEAIEAATGWAELGLKSFATRDAVVKKILCS